MPYTESIQPLRNVHETVGGARTAVPRRLLMCRPSHFDVHYSINPWMHPDKPVDTELALAQWETLRALYEELGHTVEVIEPQAGLPDMVFAANGATVVDGKVLGARFRHAERTGEGPAYLDWFRGQGFTQLLWPEYINEGEGDYLLVGRRLLAGTGFRTDPRSHAEAQEFFGLPVTGLTLVNPNHYRLDTALSVLSDTEIHVLPGGVLGRQPGGTAGDVPRCHPRRSRGRLGLRAQRLQRRPQRRATPVGEPSDRPVEGERVPSHRAGFVRTAQGGRQRQVLHPGVSMTKSSSLRDGRGGGEDSSVTQRAHNTLTR